MNILKFWSKKGIVNCINVTKEQIKAPDFTQNEISNGSIWSKKRIAIGVTRKRTGTSWCTERNRVRSERIETCLGIMLRNVSKQQRLNVSIVLRLIQSIYFYIVHLKWKVRNEDNLKKLYFIQSTKIRLKKVLKKSTKTKKLIIWTSFKYQRNYQLLLRH